METSDWIDIPHSNQCWRKGRNCNFMGSNWFNSL